MSFISYAQNFEDVMLWRALGHIEKGFYIDVGACSPDEYSITKAFYNHGWSGINIEPNPQYYAELVEKRPRDINLACAVSDQKGSVVIHLFPNTGLSTLDNSVANKQTNLGYQMNDVLVEAQTLASICINYLPFNQDIHFLKIDVEGAEESVLQGADWEKFRPWVIVIEATLPGSQVESHNSWESLLLSRNYSFVYADGLNRYYVAHERAELIAAFKYPPNVFDRMLMSSEYDARLELDALKQKMLEEKQLLLTNNELVQVELQAEKEKTAQMYRLIQELEKNERSKQQELIELQEFVEKQTSEINKLSSLVTGMTNSRSWRYTFLLRHLNAKRQSLTVARIRRFVISKIKFILSKLIQFILARPRLKFKCIKMIEFFNMKPLALKIYHKVTRKTNQPTVVMPDSEESMDFGAHVTLFLNDIKTMRKQLKDKN